MSKFFGNDEGRQGHRRAADWEYSGGVGPQPPTGIEKKLLESGMPAKDAAETAPAIVKLMGRMKDDTLADQQKMVRNFMGRFGNDEAVESITRLAKGEPTEVRKPAAPPKPPIMR